ncbi:hypothetical protein BKA70DRAFT_232310 [Coprinopsis sp. MPI-PUGE-AT-0042]|nr:hypothetical protein BKA70DRAFT_232310 [Coprinopsis sp. MPI-PUGE-AT-0042]
MAPKLKRERFAIPSLRMLRIEVHGDPWSRRVKRLDTFIPLFEIRGLTSPILPNVLSVKWSLMLDMSAANVEDHPVLHSLTIKDSPSAPLRTYSEPFKCPDVGASLPDAFPRLHHLSIVGTHANPIFQHLLKLVTIGGTEDFQKLTLDGNASTNPRHLHKFIEPKQSVGLLLSKLFLDGSLKGNADSWEWMQEEVEIAELDRDGRRLGMT